MLASVSLAAATAADDLERAGSSEPLYHFPVAAPVASLSWDDVHWDERLAVDIYADPRLAIGSAERETFYRAQVVAVVSGRASRLDNPRGGTAVVLHGDDGRTYYYAHLSQAYIEEPARVEGGEALGVIGNSGTWSQYLEPHLHLAIADGHQFGFAWTADVDPDEWINEEFGYPPVRRVRTTHPPDSPDGLPVYGKATVVTVFDAAHAANPLLAGVTIDTPAGHDPAREYGLRAPMGGAVTVHRDTPLGTRIQITNHATAFSLIISGEIDTSLATGDTALGDGYIGTADGPIHYMVFLGGSPVDPQEVPERLLNLHPTLLH